MPVLLMSLLLVTGAESDAQEQNNPGTPQYEKLLELLGDDSFTLREQATKELIKLGLTARVEVSAALDSPDAEIRNRAWFIYTTWTSEEIVNLLGDDTLSVREQATKALIQLGPTVRAEMATALDSPNAEIRSRAQRIYEEWPLTDYLLQNPGEIDFLNPKQADQLVSRYPKQLSLPNLTILFKDRDVVRELAKHKGNLALDGLRNIDSGVANELLKFEGSSLSLDGLRYIDSGAANELLKFEGSSLSLDGLRSIYEDVTRGLEMIAGLDSPDAEIRSRARRMYEEWPLTEYLLNNPPEIVSLNPKQADQLLSKHPGVLSLPNLTVIVNDKEVGRELAKYKGSLSLDGLKSIDKEFARGLALSSARKLELDGLASIDKQVARELAQFKGRYLWLSGLKSIDKDVARELASFQNELRLDGLESIDKNVAQQLAKSTAKMYLNGLRSIDTDVAQELAKSNARDLYLDGLKSIDKDAVRELASFQGGLKLRGLNSMDKDVARALARYSGTKMSFGTYLEVSDEDILEVLRSNPRIELPQKYRDSKRQATGNAVARAIAEAKAKARDEANR